jgi:ribonuclease D
VTVHLYKNDLPDGFELDGDLAIDTEAMGLNSHRDRLCLLQLSNGNGEEYLVQFERGKFEAPNLKKLLGDKSRVKIFHFARFDLAAIKQYLGIELENVFCTKIASRLCRTYTDSHGLKELCRELLSINISKQQQTSDWGKEEITVDQKEYAASDVRYLHQLRVILMEKLEREGRLGLAYNCIKFLSTRVKLDLDGWIDLDIFAH